MTPKTSTRPPSPKQVLDARLASGLTQAAAAAIVHSTGRVWRRWEAGDRQMHTAFFELFLLKTRDARSPRASAR
jgi:DNA-binding transcriptional regulator YiaG